MQSLNQPGRFDRDDGTALAYDGETVDLRAAKYDHTPTVKALHNEALNAIADKAINRAPNEAYTTNPAAKTENSFDKFPQATEFTSRAGAMIEWARHQELIG